MLSGLPEKIKAAHLESDPENQSLWFTDACGKCIGNYDPSGETPLSFHEFEDQHKNLPGGVPGMGGFPWQLQIDNEAVYVAEYSARHILRFDKASSTYHELQIPYDNPQVTLHSLTIDPLRHRLWFTLSNETAAPINRAASTIGYIDLLSWSDHVADPQRHPQIDAVLYRGLETIPAADFRPDAHQSFRGIAFDPKTGRLALATMWREQITVLSPLPGFWP